MVPLKMGVFCNTLNPHVACCNSSYMSPYYTLLLTGLCMHWTQHVNERLCVSFCRSVSTHSLRCLPHPAGHPLRGCSLPAPPAGCSQTSSVHRTQPCSHSGLLPPSPTALHEYEHELHSLLSQVSASSATARHKVSKKVSHLKRYHISKLFFSFTRHTLSPAPQFLLPQLATLQLHRELWRQQSQPSPTPLQPPPLLCCLSLAPWSGCRACPTTLEWRTFSASSRDTRSVHVALS